MERKDFCRKKGIVSFRCRERYSSKKNLVFLYELRNARGESWHWVRKKYRSPGNPIREADVLATLAGAGLAVPQLIAVEKQALILHHLPGQTLLDWYEKEEKKAQGAVLDPAVRMVLKQLALWLANCYRILEKTYGRKMILHDLNLRNFILSQGEIFGLDFEDCGPGRQEEDLGRLCAFALTYDPAFTPWKYQFVAAIRTTIVQTLNLSWPAVFTEMENELQQISRRRRRPDIAAAPIAELQ